MPSTSPGRLIAANLPSGTAGTACPSGQTICAPVSCSGSPSAVSAPATAYGRRPLTWTTSGTIEETGCCLQTRTTSRACVTPATAARPCGTCGKIAGENPETAGGKWASFGRGRAAWVRRRARARNFCKLPSPSPRGEKVSAGRCKTASLPSWGIFSPWESGREERRRGKTR